MISLAEHGRGPTVPGVDVALVLMPYADIARPSLALGLLKACLRTNQISCFVDYASLRFAETLGWGMPDLPYVERLLGEWMFAPAAFPDYPRVGAEVLMGKSAQGAFLPADVLANQKMLGALEDLRRFTPGFVRETAERILARRPRIVGCSSMFEQQCASLALLREIKRLDPSVITMLGGANCEAEMGWGTIKAFSWIDVVVSGEADELFAPLCRRLLVEGASLSLGSLPEGVFTRGHVREGVLPGGRGPVPRATVMDLNAVPYPDYDDFFEALESSPLRHRIRPGLLVETSRGCWWGAKSHCTFCGLNGGGMAFRVKQPERALDEFASLARRYGEPRFMVVDNIMDMGYFKTVLPQLAEANAPYRLFYETKANLKRDQVRLLAESGVIWIQPGIEGFHDQLLRLMAKGNNAMINLQLLKYTREFGIYTTWLLLFGFPGEEDAWHHEVAEWLPKIFHLQPPKCVGKVLYDRFSVYHQRPESFGLKLEPAPSYSAVYPVEDDSLNEIAYFFADTNEEPDAGFSPGARALIRHVVRWVKLHKRSLRPIFCMSRQADRLEFFDSRPCATARRRELAGLEAAVYLACEPALARKSLYHRFADEAPVAIDRIVDDFLTHHLMLEIDGKLLALAVEGDCPAYCDPEDFPGGNGQRLEPFTMETLEAFCARAKELANRSGPVDRTDLPEKIQAPT